MKTMNAITDITNANIITSVIGLNSPVDNNVSVEPKADGRPETIPAKIIIEIPLPIPFSVICSPNHIKNNVPVVKVITVITVNDIPGEVTKATPPAL
jgi:hypothetical protein